MEDVVKLLNAIADTISLRIIKLLTKKMCTDFELAEIMGVEISIIRDKIELLKKAGIVSEVND